MIAYAETKGFFDLENEMTLRDYFAAHAMAQIGMWDSPKNYAEECYSIADAMMEVRNASI